MSNPPSRKPPTGKSPLPTLSRDGRRRWIHPTLSRGRFFRARLVVAVVLIVAFLAIPHLRIGQKPAFQVDLGSWQLHLFGSTFFATDTLFLPVFGVGFVLFVALFTALLGRVWCGWSCPQTVYMEFLFRPLEALLEGGPSWRKRDDAAPFSRRRLVRKLGKWVLFFILSLILAHTFVAYFVATDALWAMMRGSPTSHWSTFVAVGLVTLMVFGDFAYFREQTCFIACPYGRFQSVLIDAGTVIVGYDPARGEPRKKAIDRNKDHDDAGHCVDCSACVRTCPTGIDIRDGLQLECVGCTQCIDACDAIMDRVKKPRGLVRYTSLDQLQGKNVRFFRPRVLVYSAIVVVATVAMVTLANTRDTFEFDVLRRPGAQFYVQSDGIVVNRVRFRITNRTDREQKFTLSLAEPRDARLIVRGSPVKLAPRSVVSLDALITMQPSTIAAGRLSGEVEVVSSEGASQRRDLVLQGPPRGGAR